MTNTHDKSGRLTAAQILDKLDIKTDYASQLLDRFLPSTSQPQRTTDLVFGVIRNLATIETTISAFAGCPTQNISKKLINPIRIAAYELIYTPDAADYAIVNEAIETAKTLASKKHAGFVNALLRNITRQIANRKASRSDSNVKRLLPACPDFGCEFKTDFLPDPAKSPSDYFVAAFSLPKWLIENWLTHFGFEQTAEICLASNRRPSVYLRPNTLKTSLEELTALLQKESVDFEIVDSSMLRLKSPKSVAKLPGFAEGLFTVGDPTSAKAVIALAPKPGQIILDLCSAPGTKTAQLAALTGDRATIITTDLDSSRLKSVTANVARLKLKSVTVVEYDKLASAIENIGRPDLVLLDVPCSNTGVLSRRPEVRHRINPKAISDLAVAQSQILKNVLPLLKPGSKICYSTCSIEESENSGQIQAFSKTHPDFKLESEHLTLPSPHNPDHDGGYYAILAYK